MYENKKQKLAPRTVYLKRIRKNALMAGIVLFFSLSLGVVGYKLTIPEMGWYDSLLNASMILSGMGPIIDPTLELSRTAKVFASAYALFSGITFLSTFGLLIAPVVHRFFHRIHLEDED